MSIKSQQDIKNENKAKSEKVPKSMENKLTQKTQQVSQKPTDPVSNTELPSKYPVSNTEVPSKYPVSVIERINAIEEYLEKVDMAFDTISEELKNVKTFIKIMQDMDAELSKLTGDIIRLTKIQEERYIEIATAINTTNEKIETLDKYIPIFIDKKLQNYFEELSQEETHQENIPE